MSQSLHDPNSLQHEDDNSWLQNAPPVPPMEDTPDYGDASSAPPTQTPLEFLTDQPIVKPPQPRSRPKKSQTNLLPRIPVAPIYHDSIRRSQQPDILKTKNPTERRLALADYIIGRLREGYDTIKAVDKNLPAGAAKTIINPVLGTQIPRGGKGSRLLPHVRDALANGNIDLLDSPEYRNTAQKYRQPLLELARYHRLLYPEIGGAMTLRQAFLKKGVECHELAIVADALVLAYARRQSVIHSSGLKPSNAGTKPEAFMDEIITGLKNKG